MNLKTLRIIVLFGTLALFLYQVNTGIFGAERLIAEGTPVYLELAPVDPRSLVQGDYMALNYAIEREAGDAGMITLSRGQFVAQLDENRVAHYLREYDGGELVEGEILIQYKIDGFGFVSVGVDSFFFQEGLAQKYSRARYADVRVTADGTVLLVDLVDEDFRDLVSGTD